MRFGIASVSLFKLPFTILAALKLAPSMSRFKANILFF